MALANPPKLAYSCGALGLGDGACPARSPWSDTGEEMNAAARAAGWHICRGSLLLAKADAFPDVAPFGAACPAHASAEGACPHCAAIVEAEAKATP